ncbi:MAG: HEAT repeat domain-containing protein, partial [Planctomycetes bacterium]|nr:HEAT repeat domain-containing protein [Planctomycetota bacterium]
MSASLLDWYPGDHAAGLVLIVLAQTAILAAVALLVSARLRRNAAARHVVLLSALVAAAVCPAMTYVFDVAEVSLGIIPGRLEVGSPIQPVSQPTAAPQKASTEVAAEIIEEPSSSGSQNSSGGTSVGSPVARIDGTVTRESSLLEKLRAAFVLGLVAWAGVAIVRCVGIARSWWKMHSIARAARPVAKGNHARLLAELRRRLGVRKLPAIASSPAVSVPVAAGLVHPLIIIPSAIRDKLSEDQWRDVLVHETAHVLRHDHLLALVQRVIGAVFWVNPLVHVLNRRLVRAREEVCDNYVLSFTDSRSYGKTLLGLAELIPQAGRSTVSPGLLGVRWTLEERISGLLDPRRNAMTRTTTYTAALVLGAHLSAAALLAAAGTAKAPDRGAEQPAADADQPGERAEPASHAETDWQSVEARIAEAKRARRIESELNLPTSLQMENGPLWRLRKEIESCHELKVRLEFLNEDERVTINTAKGVRLRDALRPLNLGFRVDGDEVVMAPLRSIELRAFGETKPVGHWVGALKDDNPHIRRRAAEILSALAGLPRDSIPSLVEAMKDPNAPVRRWSARALGNLGTDAGPAVPPLVDAIDDEAA